MKLDIRPVLSLSLALLLAVPSVAAPKPGGGGGNKNNGAVRSTSRSNVNQPSSAKNAASNRNANTNNNSNVNRNTNVNKSTNVNKNSNVNRNTNVNVNRDVDVNVNHSNNYYGGGGCCLSQRGRCDCGGCNNSSRDCCNRRIKCEHACAQLHHRHREWRHVPAVRRLLLSATVLRRKYDLHRGQPAVGCQRIAKNMHCLKAPSARLGSPLFRSRIRYRLHQDGECRVSTSQPQEDSRVAARSEIRATASESLARREQIALIQEPPVEHVSRRGRRRPPSLAKRIADLGRITPNPCG
jgi:hypothetical protein